MRGGRRATRMAGLSLAQQASLQVVLGCSACLPSRLQDRRTHLPMP